jgi:deoxyribodipyrimidine photo-lyase
MPAEAPVIVWFRQDLRISDNPALAAAVATGAPIVPVYVLDEESAGARAIGGAARWWLHNSLAKLAEGLSERGLPLVLRRGAAAHVIETLASEAGARAVFWNRCYEPQSSVAQASRGPSSKANHSAAVSRTTAPAW